MPTRTPWKFEDLVALTEVNREINPAESDAAPIERSILYQSTAAPSGRVLMFEGRVKPRMMTFSGTLLTEDQFNVWKTWTQKQNQIKLTDHLGREYMIVLTSFKPKMNKTSFLYPWKHTFTADCVIVAEL